MMHSRRCIGAQSHRYASTVERHEELQPLAEVIRSYRRAAGYTQEGFAYESHLDRGFVGAVERAERNVGFRKIRQLLVGLGINWREFGAALQDLDPLPTRSHRGRGDRKSSD
jgi:transcriptional regulator with XRE-family HTH domain